MCGKWERAWRRCAQLLVPADADDALLCLNQGFLWELATGVSACTCSVAGLSLFAPFQMCETRVAAPFYAPCTAYKLTVEWAQHTDDRQVLPPPPDVERCGALRFVRWTGSTHGRTPPHTRAVTCWYLPVDICIFPLPCLQSLGWAWQQEGMLPSPELASYLWAPGPAVYKLVDVVAQGRFHR